MQASAAVVALQDVLSIVSCNLRDGNFVCLFRVSCCFNSTGSRFLPEIGLQSRTRARFASKTSSGLWVHAWVCSQILASVILHAADARSSRESMELKGIARQCCELVLRRLLL